MDPRCMTSKVICYFVRFFFFCSILQESALEPMNGEIIDDTLKTSLVTEEEDSTSEVLDEELKLQSFNSNEDSTNLAPLVVDSSQPLEGVAQEKVIEK